jgi:YbbR domain-containing protein
MRRLPGALLFVLRGAVTSIAGNLSLAALAMALALSLWLFVTDRENPTQQETFGSTIPLTFVNVPDDLAVSNASRTTVSIRIEAPESELDGLQRDDFAATVNLAGLERGVQTASVDVTTPNRRVDVIGINPANVEVTLESRRSKDVPVRIGLIGSPISGFAAGDQRAEPETATVTGPESLVELVDAVVAEVNLTGRRVDVTEDRVALQPRDIGGGEISRVSVNPETAGVTVELEQREFSLEFTVSPSIVGQPAAGYNVAGIAVEPRIVVVSGPLDVLQSIDAVRGIGTDEISIADARDDTVRTVDLVLPEGARVEGSSEARVTVDVNPARGQASFLVAPQVNNVGDGIVVTQASAVLVTLEGDVPVLQSIVPEAISVVVDAQGLAPGLHALTMEITPPAGTNVVRTDPEQLGIALTQQ